ncbi:hypothetical protein [Absidia glauca]|uniref:RING-type domain-containing protein n=1 Tax=Absidia glauca TaxID=4829 RepID=A0A168RGV8_ABSGL|nr:hypothetical protein [Absidia glauca]
MVSYLHTFPLIAPADDKGQVYRGFIQIHQKEHFLEIHLANAATGTPASIYGSHELQSLLSSHQHTIQGRLDQCQDIGLFLSDLKDSLEQIIPPILDLERLKPSSERYTLLVDELNTIGYDNLDTMNDTMTELVFKCQDLGGRCHLIKASIPPQFPLQPPALTLDLPTANSTTTAIQHPSITSPSLSVMLNNALHTLNQYQSFFDTMDRIDEQARVLDPLKPLRSDTWRRIALGNHCSLQLTLPDAACPTQSPPQIRFFGNEKKVAPFQQAWQRFVESHQWRTDLSVLDNLAAPLPSILRLSTPAESNVAMDTKDDDMACAICYAYRLDGGDAQHQETPDTICANPQCNRGFHPSCLYEWLRSNPTTTRSFNVLFGNCPYCNDKITIKAIL